MIYTLNYEDRDILEDFADCVQSTDVVFVDIVEDNIEAFVIARPCQCSKYPGKIGVLDTYVKHSPKSSKGFYKECESRLKEYGYKFIIVHEPYDERIKARDRLVKSQGFKELTKEYIKEL